MAGPAPDLGDLEREVMDLVWRLGPVTAESVRKHLAQTLKDSTVRTVLKRLEGKGYVSHRVEGRTYLFQAVDTRRVVAARAVRRVVDWFCSGSVDEVLVGMIDSDMLDREQLQRLLDAVDAADRTEKP